MKLDDTADLSIDPALKDDLHKAKRDGFKRYLSPWVRIDASESYSFPHGLREIPHVASVLEATDSQGTEQAEASSVTVTKTVSIVGVTNSGTPRFFRVRAF